MVSWLMADGRNAWEIRTHARADQPFPIRPFRGNQGARFALLADPFSIICGTRLTPDHENMKTTPENGSPAECPVALRFPFASVLLLTLALFLSSSAPVAAQSAAASKAAQLMKQRLYHDAVEVLEKSVQEQGEHTSGVELRMLAECLYLTKEYAKARPMFSRALTKASTDRTRIVCESRLAMLAYRLRDYEGAEERI